LRVARCNAPGLYEWSGVATVNFPKRSIPGILTVRWDGSTISGSLERQDPISPGPIGPESSPGRLRGPDAIGEMRLQNISLEGISGNFAPLGGLTTSSYTAHRLTVTENAGLSAFHRYCFRGGRLHGWAVTTERIDSQTDKSHHFQALRDSFDAHLFGRRTRITQTHDDELDQRAQVISVTVQGEPLCERDERLLWLVLSFTVGNRVQPISVEHFDAEAKRLELTMLNAVEYGEQAAAPPFDLRISERTFSAPDFARLVDGFGDLEAAGYPIAEALHHLHDANTGYTQVELKNLLFCIHTLFESWADKNGQRDIMGDADHKRQRKKLSTELDRVFGAGTEIRDAVLAAIRTANHRVGAQLQEVFFDSLGVVLSGEDLRALRRRNSLFHNGYLVREKGQSQLAFYQELFDDAMAVRTLAHIAILKLAGYSGNVFDYRTWSNTIVTSGYPDSHHGC
jgi:hypothetical protein